MPSKLRNGERLIALLIRCWAKVLLLNQMIERNIRPSDVARLLKTTPQEVNRMIDLHHVTKIDRLNDALQALGKELEIAIV